MLNREHKYILRKEIFFMIPDIVNYKIIRVRPSPEGSCCYDDGEA